MKRISKENKGIGKIILFVLLITAIISVVGAVTINELYKLNCGYITLWNVEDTLNFFGTVLSFIGTILVSIVAIWQTHKYTKETEIKENKRFAYEHSVLFDFELDRAMLFDNKQDLKVMRDVKSGFNGYKVVFNYKNAEHIQLSFKIKNISNFVATNICVVDEIGAQIKEYTVIHSENGDNNKKHIKGGEAGYLYIMIPQKVLARNDLKYFLSFSNQFGNEFQQSILIKYEYNEKLILVDTSCIIEYKQRNNKFY